ncbi:MAG: hypothetical protein JWO24_3566 [Rhodospirillales bacterium]|jgi:hypothetical protein|nr:hypothetical protein [Rhodospirillales bacterium]
MVKPPVPNPTETKRISREAAALRENLRKRKQQARAREDHPTADSPPPLPPKPPLR